MAIASFSLTLESLAKTDTVVLASTVLSSMTASEIIASACLISKLLNFSTWVNGCCSCILSVMLINIWRGGGKEKSEIS